MKTKGLHQIELYCKNSIKKIKISELGDKQKSEKISKIKNDTLDMIKDLIYSK